MLPLAKRGPAEKKKKKWPCGLDFKSWGGSLTIRGALNRNAYSKCCIIAYFSSCSVLVEEWCRVLLDCLFDIVLLLWLHSFLFCIRLGIWSGIIWESGRCLKPSKPPFSLGRPMWYQFHGVFSAEFSLHLGKIAGMERVKQW